MTGDRRGGVVPSPSDAQQVLRQLNVRLEGALHCTCDCRGVM
jgi:hypothetical protein